MRWFAGFCLGALSGLVLSSVTPAGEKNLPPLNAKVLKFAESHLGKQVGDGECTTLADEAMAAAKARRPGQNGYAPFVFGRQLKPKEAILPGDIGQFTEAKFAPKKGNWAVMPQHTAIVAEVDGSKLKILHQNWNKSRDVSPLRLDLADLTKGKVAFFRPQALD